MSSETLRGLLRQGPSAGERKPAGFSLVSGGRPEHFLQPEGALRSVAAACTLSLREGPPLESIRLLSPQDFGGDTPLGLLLSQPPPFLSFQEVVRLPVTPLCKAPGKCTSRSYSLTPCHLPHTPDLSPSECPLCPFPPYALCQGSGS